MGSKKHKKESRKRKHHSRSESRSPDREVEKEKRKHKKHRHHHHKDKKKDKLANNVIRIDNISESLSSDSDDDVIYVPPPPTISKTSPSPPPAPVIVPAPPAPVITRVRSPPPAPPPPSITSGGNSEQSLSIEDTNALRAKLGLKPLSISSNERQAGPPQGPQPVPPPGPRPVPPPGRSLTQSVPLPVPRPIQTKEPQVLVCPETNVTFVHKPAENLTSKKLMEKLKGRITERKEKRELEMKLASIKSLGAESDDESAANWVKKSRKQSEDKLKAMLKAKELDEMDEEFGIGDLVEEEIKREKKVAYGVTDLRGLKVEHDVDTFAEGRSVILTLKDKGVLEEEDDALVNVNMVDDERYKKNVLNKKTSAFGYNGVDNGDMDLDSPSGVLSKYDEEIDGLKKSSFKLGEANSVQTKMKLKGFLREDKKVKLESLATSELTLASDYYTKDEIKIKKPKKKKKIRNRMLKADELIGDVQEEGNHRSRNAARGVIDNHRIKVESEDPMLIDEIPSVPVLGYDDIKIEEESDTELELALQKARRLKQMPTEKPPKKLPKIEDVLMHVKEEQEDEVAASSIVLNSTAEFCRTLGDIPTYGLAGNRDEEPDVLLDIERNELKRKMQEELEDRGGWNDVEMEEKLVETKQIEGTILDAEPDLGTGVGGALQLAVSKGYLEKETSNRPSASRFSHLAAQNYSIDDKAHAGEDEKVGRRERYLGPTQDFKEKDGYKPNIKLEYIDDDGHLLVAKEAFRYLSHKFHGKGPGKNKVEKRMKKNEQEVLMKQMSSSDTPLGTLQMLQYKQKETQSPFVVLSGSKALSTPSISKPKMSK